MSCTVDEQCNPDNADGYCDDGSCLCVRRHYGGDFCEVDWFDDTAWKAVFFTHVVTVILLNLAVVITASLAIWGNYVKTKQAKQKSANIAFWVNLMAIIGCSIRIVHYCIDPQGVYGIIPLWVDGLLNLLPFVFWFIAAGLMLLFWLEVIGNHTDTIKVKVSKHAIWAMIAFFVVFSIILVPVGVIQSMSRSTELTLVLLFCSFMLYISFVIPLLLLGYKMRKILKASTNLSNANTNTTENAAFRYLKKISKFLNLMIFNAVITIFVYICFAAFFRTKWPGLIFFWLFRIYSAFTIFVIVLVVWTPPPKKDLFARDRSKTGSSGYRSRSRAGSQATQVMSSRSRAGTFGTQTATQYKDKSGEVGNASDKQFTDTSDWFEETADQNKPKARLSLKLSPFTKQQQVDTNLPVILEPKLSEDESRTPTLGHSRTPSEVNEDTPLSKT